MPKEPRTAVLEVANDRRRDPDGDDLWLNWIVRLRDGRAIGYVQATVAGDVADLAWVIGAPHQGRGFAAEAAGAMAAWLMDTLGITTLAASISDDAASCGVASRIGLMPTEVFDDGERVWIRRAGRSGSSLPSSSSGTSFVSPNGRWVLRSGSRIG